MKVRAKKISSILFCIALSIFFISQSIPEIRAEKLPFRKYTTADGLAHDRVNRIVRDTRGFLWFCTGEGLSRFDGYAFNNYTQAQGLPHRNTTDLIELPDGTYLVGTYDGLAVFNPNGAAPDENASEKTQAPMFRTFRQPDIKPDKPASIQDLLQTRDGNIWAATVNGLYRFVRDGAEWRFEKFEHEVFRGIKPEFATLFEDHNGAIWIGTSTSLFLYNPRTGIVSQLLDKIGVASIYEDQQKRVWVGGGYNTESGLNLFTFSPLNQPALSRNFSQKDGLNGVEWLTESIQTRDGRILVGSAGALSEFMPNASEGEPSFRTIFQADILAVAEDADGNTWLGTATGGTIKLAGSGFVLFDEKDNVPLQTIQSIATGTGSEIFSVSGKFDVLYYNGEKFSIIKPSGMTPRSWGWGQLDFRARDGEWWIGTAAGLLRYPAVKNAKDLEHTPPIKTFTTKDGLFNDEIFRMYEDSRGDVWLSVPGKAADMGNSVVRWERATEKFHAYTNEQGIPYGNAATSFIEDRSGNIWIGFYYGGVGRWRDGQFRFFSAQEGFPSGLIHSMLVDTAGRLWIATSSSGIVRIDNPAEDKPQLTKLTVANGISSNQILCITEDNFGRIYAATGRGVTRIDPASNRIKIYTLADGLDVSYVRACGRDENGNLWFGQDKKLARLIPEKQEGNEAPPIFIADFRANGVKVRKLSELGEVAVTDVNLTSDQREIQIDFFALGFDTGETLRYQYKLYGVEDEWSKPSTQRTVNLNLSPGSYRFLVRAVSSEGVTSGAPASISFTIAHPIWQLWWFWVVVALIIGAIVYAFYRNRFLRLLELEKVRTRIATDLHDDIGSSLSQIAILSEVVRQKVGENGVNEPLKVIAGTSREMVDSMSDIVWAINPNKDHVSDLVQRMRRFASDVLDAKDVAYQFIAPQIARNLPLGTDLRREIYLIFKECINNLAKHSGASRAKIELKVANNYFTFSIEDDGKGFNVENILTENHHTLGGNGLINMKQRAGNLGGDFLIDSKEGRGTKVMLEVPLKRKNWQENLKFSKTT